MRTKVVCLGILCTFALGSAAWAAASGGHEGQDPHHGAQAAGAQASHDCDVSDVQSMPYCDACHLIIEHPDTQLHEGNCAACHGAVHNVDVCVKHYWECGHCHGQAAAAGECAGCHMALEEHASCCLVVYVCGGSCHGHSDHAGNCTAADCDHHGQALTRSCANSGTFPHGGEPHHGGR